MKKLNMEKAIKRYNDIMYDCGIEHMTIGTNFSSPDTENFTLADMVHEAEYWLSCYYEAGHVRCDDRFCGEVCYKIWLSETGKLKRFINAYKPFLQDR